MSSQIKKQIIAALNSDKESLLVEKLLAQSKDNFQRNFGKNGYADWIYADLEDLIRENTATPKQADKQTHTDHPARHWDRTCPACVAEAIEAALKEKNTCLLGEQPQTGSCYCCKNHPLQRLKSAAD